MEKVSEGSDRVLAASVAADLRRVLADAPTLTALRELDVGHVDSILRPVGLARSDLPELITTAISRLDDQVYRAAARDLFPLPYGDTGWAKLSVRGRLAAERFGISYEGLRKASEGRPSYLDKVLTQVADRLVQVAGERDEVQSTQIERWAPTSASPDAGSQDDLCAQRSRRTIPILLVTGLVLAVFVALVAWSRSRPGPGPGAMPTSVYLPGGCATAVGSLDTELAKEPEAGEWRSRLVATYRLLADYGSSCPTAPAYRWQSIVVQELRRDGRANGALLVSPNSVDLYFNNAAWGSYHQIGGKTGTAAQTTGGLPIRMVTFADGHVEIELSTGTILVAERFDAPFFWIPAVFVPWWHDQLPQVGLPTGNPLPTLRQDFQKGLVNVNSAQPGLPVFTAIDQISAELPTVDTIRERILTQADGTSWFISPDGKRLWIPDGPTWDCLGGDGRRVARDLPGYAIASLAFGGQAECQR